MPKKPIQKKTNELIDVQSITPIRHYVLNEEDLKEVNIVVKNNTIMGMEEFGKDGLTLKGLDVQVLSSALLAAHIIKEKRQAFDGNTRFTIPFPLFLQMWQIIDETKPKPSVNLYRDLRRSISRLNCRKFHYPNATGTALVESGYFQFIEYQHANITFAFPLTIIEYLNKNNDFTWYFLENVLKIQKEGESSIMRNNAQVLFENLHKVKNYSDLRNNKGEIVVNFSTTKLRKMFNIEGSNYSRHIDFRVKLLDKIVNFLKERIQLDIKIENIFTGRSVTGYQFIVKFAELDMDFVRAISKDKLSKPILTIAQRRRYAPLLVGDTAFNSTFRLPNEEADAFLQRIISNLMDNDKVASYSEYLGRLGFKSKKLELYMSESSQTVNKDQVVTQGLLDLVDAIQGDLRDPKVAEAIIDVIAEVKEQRKSESTKMLTKESQGESDLFLPF